jgi:tetratricopeptide (TPR) repeat protein
MSKWWWALPIFGVAMALLLVLKEGRRDAAPPPAAPAAPAQPAAPAISEARQLAAKARAMSLDKYNSTADDYAAAEGLLKRALELDPNDAEIWAVSSQFNTLIRTRGFDSDPARREAARSQAERALSLAPDSIEGKYALARWQRDNDPDPTVAERTFKEVLARVPNHAGALGSLGTFYQRTGRYEEAIAVFDQLALQPEWKPLARFSEFLAHFSRSKFPEAEQCIRESVALVPSANSVSGLGMLQLTARGDAAGAVATMAAVPVASRNDHRVVWVTAFAQLEARQPDEALKTLDRLSADYIQDNWFTGPKAYWVGRAHAQAGRPEAARLAFESGLELVTARLKGQPGSFTLHFVHAELLAWLGRTEEALAEGRLLMELRQPYNNYWFTNRARIFALLGRADEAVPLLRELVLDRGGKDWGWPLTPALLRLDPLWDKIRGDARFQDLLTEADAADIAALPPRDWPKNPELKRAVALLDGLQAIPEDIRLAEEIVQPVLEKFPTDPETMAAMARVQSMWLLRGWDRSTARYQKAKGISERALQLAPDEPEALQAMAIYLYSRGTENQRALDLAQRAVDLAPQVPRFYRQRDNCLFVLSLSSTDVLTDQTMQRKNAALQRAVDSARRTTQLFPGDALVHYELARHYRDLGRWAEFEKETDVTLALAPVANAMVWKARARLGLHNDLAGMKALLDQVPNRVRSIERTVFAYFLYSAYTGNVREGLEALNGMTESWMVDFDFRGPKALPIAALLELGGKKELARLQYEAAQQELLRGRAANPADVQTYLVEAWILHGLGHDEEARTALRVYNESILRPYTVTPMAGWWFHPIAANLLMGEHGTALELMRDAVASQAEGRATLRGRFAVDRRMAPFRDDPEIKALLAEPEEKK